MTARKTRKGPGIVDERIEIRVEITPEQKSWVDDQARAKGLTSDGVLREILTSYVESHKKDPEMPQRARMRLDFDRLLENHDLDDQQIRDVRRFVRELELRLDIADKEFSVQRMRDRLSEMRMGYDPEDS